MVLLSLNIRGLGGPLKASTFRRLLSHISPDIIFLQETLVDGQKTRFFLNMFCPDWITCSVNSLGTSGGLAAAWDSNKFDLVPFLRRRGILLTGFCRWNNLQRNLLNTYGPCLHRKLFWDTVESSGLLDFQNLIIADDLNFTTSLGEMWGHSAAKDPLTDFFNALFIAHDLIDIQPDFLAPTLRNGRLGSTSISKRLDRFYLSESLLTMDEIIRTWVDSPFLSDHAPTLLQFGTYATRLSIPFKLNSCRLAEDGFTAIVFAVWNDPKFQSESSIQQCFS
jgi:hypothetical protein